MGRSMLWEFYGAVFLSKQSPVVFKTIIKVYKNIMLNECSAVAATQCLVQPARTAGKGHSGKGKCVQTWVTAGWTTHCFVSDSVCGGQPPRVFNLNYLLM